MDEIQDKPKAEPISDISPDGDVVLIVGPEQVRLRVQSQNLRSASKVFHAMFNSCWSEGQSLRKGLPLEVTLDEDNADALRVICCIIHFRNDHVPKSPEPIELFHIAIAADKYGFNLALEFIMIQWFKSRPSQDDLDYLDMGHLLTAAFLFGDTNLFAARTMELIIGYSGSYLDFPEWKVINRIVPWKIFCKYQR